MQCCLIIPVTSSIYFVLCFSLTYSSMVDDYWSANFDADQECKHRKRIDELSNMEPSRCVTVNGEDEKAFSDCEIRLYNNLQRFCDVRDDDI